MLAETDPPPSLKQPWQGIDKRTILVKVTRADGVRVKLIMVNTTMAAACYHVGEVFPGHRDYQLILVARESARAS